MPSSLLACRSCRRHCRSSDFKCPFCGARKLVVCAGVITFGALGIAWTDDGGADATAAPTVQDAGVDATVPQIDDPGRWAVAIYGTVPPPHRPGC